MPKARSVKKRPHNKRSPAQILNFARNHAHKPYVPLTTSAASTSANRALASQPNNAPAAVHPHDRSTLQLLLTHTTNLLNDALAERDTALAQLEEQSHEINDLENELELQELETTKLDNIRDDLTRQLMQNMHPDIQDMENELSQQGIEIIMLRKELFLARTKNSQLSDSLLRAEAQLKTNYSLLRNERRKTSRGIAANKLAHTVSFLRELEVLEAKKQSDLLEDANQQLEKNISALEATNQQDKDEISRLQDRSRGLMKKIKKLQMRCLRAPKVKSNAVAKAKEKALVFKLTHGRTYTPTARALARKLERHGCSQEFVGVVIEDVCNAAGVRVNKRMSRRTVGRSIGEGAVAAKIQIVDEMAHASSVFHWE
ncbi:hypothetical protein B0H17DRAFT_1144582 [Mycena rosella]|uniref:Uncharacterized protein n=1 Tax=Mycena rosella TaxID=1033263 RepID=A0AAD7CT44_MYCRO|nr:hypothetical protein B0H17DRAFT_1144582 [Mycena rosella]